MRSLVDGLRRSARGRTLELGPGTPVERLPFGSQSFDTVVTVLVLRRAADARSVVAELRRVLRPGGRLLFAEPPRAQTSTSECDTLVMLTDGGFTIDVRSRIETTGRWMRSERLVVGAAHVGPG